MGAALFRAKSKPSVLSEVPTLTCLWLAARNNLGRIRYTNMRLQLLKHVKLQPYSHLSQLRMSICPNIQPWPIESSSGLEVQRGVYANLGEAVRRVLQRMIEHGSSEFFPCCSSDIHCSNLVATVHLSGDGRGDEKQYSQVSQVGKHWVNRYFETNLFSSAGGFRHQSCSLFCFLDPHHFQSSCPTGIGSPNAESASLLHQHLSNVRFQGNTTPAETALLWLSKQISFGGGGY